MNIIFTSEFERFGEGKSHHLYRMKNKLAIFDFDGTISKIDSTKFLKNSFGKIYFFMATI